MAAFQYTPEWLQAGFSISPFSLPLEDRVLVADAHPLGGLFGVFDDSLPDGWGRLLVDIMLAAQGYDPHQVGFWRAWPLWAPAVSRHERRTRNHGEWQGARHYHPRFACRHKQRRHSKNPCIRHNPTHARGFKTRQITRSLVTFCEYAVGSIV
ncbi:MAG: HipA N-terminal domain-containing protein [Coriobacteriia bacterium]|nr:HipA N-terminal domain-containing protein [Coriobacteriia bacterium]